MRVDKAKNGLRIPPPEGVVGHSAAMQDVYRLLQRSAGVETPVLFLGEIGTGKCLMAWVLHALSERKSRPFLSVDCSSLSEEPLERLLFGRGVASGCFEQAHGGTILLNEIQALPGRLQSKLLTVLHDGCFQRHGERNSIEVRVRLIAATSCDLNRAVSEGSFREELYWKLSVLPIALPPLRRRAGDIELLAQHFLRRFAEMHRRPLSSIESAAMKTLAQYSWPGNVRELQTYMERAVVWSEPEQKQITLESLPQAVVGDSKAAQTAVFRPADELSLIREFVYSRISKAESNAEDLHKQIVEPVERELLLQIMEACHQTQTKAASRLGINRNTLYKKLVEFGLTKSNGEREET
jgi:DNA-binding NtrC family response regulator